MLKDIKEACDLSDSFVLDDSLSLLKALMKYSSVPAKDEKPSQLHKLGIEIRLKQKEVEGFYFMGEKYRFYNPLDVADMIDFIALNYKQDPVIKDESTNNFLFDKIIKNADPGNYITVACADYNEEKEEHHELNNLVNNKLFLMNFRTDNNKNRQSDSS